ncbi:AAA family ATPase [Pedobacter aquae]|uniref:AAA family ATPase n=1 Tax=Pedobacter aquae TaxID=2605747 RepID=A0A5C0VGN4_9SPHI|nr:AAA family ATPase [Pedobacter aquae]QEK51033.1 AAA family ATPase [Pedobacter aquae]
MITKIEIEGYKSIKHLSINLLPINILLGGNGVGKSNFISLFTLIRNIYNRNLENYVLTKGGADSLLHFGKKNTKEINIDIYFGTALRAENRFILGLQSGNNDNLFIKYTKTAFNSYDRWHIQDFETNVKESQFATFNHRQAYYVNYRLMQFDVYHFHDTSDTSPLKGMCDLHDNIRLRRNGSNLASFLYYLKEKEPKHFKRIELTVKSIAPFFDRFVLQPNRLNERKIQLEWQEKGFPDSYFNASHLSDGTLRFICLATLLMQPKPPATIIIDEPELGLHPVAINKLAALIRKASENTQIIISTQSINLIDNFSPEDIIVTDRSKDGSVFKRLNSEDLQDWLTEYSLGDLWGKNQLGAQPYSI